jgi:hypothetical protein
LAGLASLYSREDTDAECWEAKHSAQYAARSVRQGRQADLSGEAARKSEEENPRR